VLRACTHPPRFFAAHSLSLTHSHNSHTLTHARAQPVRNAFHGLLLGVVLGGEQAGTVTVTATADGLAPGRLDIAQALPPAGDSKAWCYTGLTL
jgi:hypothetical protein